MGQVHRARRKAGEAAELARELAARFHGDVAAETAVAGWNAAVRGEGDTASLPLSDVRVPAEGVRIAALPACASPVPE